MILLGIMVGLEYLIYLNRFARESTFIIKNLIFLFLINT